MRAESGESGSSLGNDYRDAIERKAETRRARITGVGAAKMEKVVSNISPRKRMWIGWPVTDKGGTEPK